MKTFNKFLLLLSILILMACEEPIEPLINKSDKLLGYWFNPVPVDTLCRYERTYAFDDCSYGFFFNSDHLFVERKNAGWCGTPPISYANFEGSWSRNDSLINITVDYWGGKVDYQWKIISVDDQYLTVGKVKEEYRNQE